MKRTALTVIFAVAGSVAWAQLGPEFGPTVRTLPEPSTIALCILGLAAFTLPGRKTT